MTAAAVEDEPPASSRSVGMPPTDIGNPDYFHKVVDCQWACPAHTPVPEYIRLIAAGRYADAYMVNWKSNVFPGVLGPHLRPALRAGLPPRPGREAEPVAICRLKRVAADNKDDIEGRMPAAAGAERTASAWPDRRRPRIADRGARSAAAGLRGRAVSTARQKAGGMMRTQIPQFRLPESGDRRGSQLHPRPPTRQRLGHRRRHLRPAGEGLRRHFCRLWRAARPRARPAGPQGSRGQHPYRHRLAVPASPSAHHQIGKRVIVLGGGNTAMDCCRTSRRLGGDEVKVIVRSGFEEMKASPWEKEDAMHEGIPIHNFLVPKAFTHEGGKLTGVLSRR